MPERNPNIRGFSLSFGTQLPTVILRLILLLQKSASSKTLD